MVDVLMITFNEAVNLPHSLAPLEGIDPNWLAGREPVDGRATAYVCRGTSCSLPITDPADLAPLDPSPETTTE